MHENRLHGLPSLSLGLANVYLLDGTLAGLVYGKEKSVRFDLFSDFGYSADNGQDVAGDCFEITIRKNQADGGLQVLLHGVEPKGALQWFPAKVEVAGLGRAGYTLLYPVDEETFERQTLNGEGRIVYTLVE